MQNYKQYSETELKEVYEKCMAQCMEFENETPNDDELHNILQKFQDIQQNVIKQHVFSPNEAFEEIQTENLKYLLLPYYMGELFGMIQNPDTRKHNLKLCEVYLNEYVKLMDHYQLLPKNIKQQWKKLKDQGHQYKADREDKIGNFKETQQLNYKLKNLEKLDDEKSKRELIGVIVITKLYKVLDLLPLLWQEVDILEYKEKIHKDQSLQNKHNEEMQKAIPKMKVWNIPKMEDPKPQFLGHHGCTCNTESELKQQYTAQVWQPTNMPTMTLDEFADMEIENMRKQEEAQKKAMEEAKLLEDQDEDKDEFVDQQTLKDRYWDDWKDANEKGAGNKKGR